MLIVHRIQPPVVKIIGISSGIYRGPSSMKYCQLWYSELTSPIVNAAEYVIVPETHDRKYVIFLSLVLLLLICYIDYQFEFL